MEFEGSTQAKSWLFDHASLLSCKQRAVTLDDAATTSMLMGVGRIRKFASGYHHRREKTACGASTTLQQDSTTSNAAALPPRVASFSSSPSFSPSSSSSPATLPSAITEQEQIISFHCHQLFSLIGPNALLPDLRTGEVVLATAITFLRRFYLSNSVVDISPRKIAVACAFLAAKVEEEKIDIDSLARASALVQMHVHNAPLCARELRAVSAQEIMYTELLLLEGLNYQFRCYHATSAIDSLVTDAYNFQHDVTKPLMMMDFYGCDSRDPTDCAQSPRSTTSLYYSSHHHHQREAAVRDRACEIAMRATIFADAMFLYTPCHIALAILSIVTGCVNPDGSINWTMERYLASRFDTKDPGDVQRFSTIIREIILMLVHSPGMDLQPPHHQHYDPSSSSSNHIRHHNYYDVVTRRAEDLHRVLGDTATRRMHRRMQRLRRAPRKRSRSATTMDIIDFTPPRHNTKQQRRQTLPTTTTMHVRVTPTGGMGY